MRLRVLAAAIAVLSSLLLLPVTPATAADAPSAPIVGIAATPDGRGYWLTGFDGAVYAYGNATSFGSLAGMPLNRPVVGIAATPTGRGYWLVASDGGIFSFGDARFFGSTGGMRLNQPIVGMASTATGRGYWLVARDGGIFSFGDARFYGSTGSIALNQPIVGMAATDGGNGYWLVASDGGIFAFGDARFYGSTGGIRLNQPIVGTAPTPTGRGYWLVARDAGVFSFGDAQFRGAGGVSGAVAVARARDGYVIAGFDGAVQGFAGASGLSRQPSTGRPGVSPLPPRQPVPGSSSPFAALGLYPGNPNSGGLDVMDRREDWLDRTLHYFTAYGEGSSLSGFNNNIGGQFRTDRLAQWDAQGKQPPFRLVYMTPLAFGPRYDNNATNGALVLEQWDALINNTTVRSSHPYAAGFSRQTYRDLARRLVDNGYGNAIIRLASEHDNTGSRWASEIDYTKFKAAFRAAVDAMRSVAPNIEIDYTNIRLNFGTGTNPASKIVNAYPGDAYVDYIGVDIYDQGNVDDSIGVPAGQKCGWRNPQAVFDQLHRPYLETAARFAINHGKKISLPEWGLSGGGTKFYGRCGGDNPTFITNIHNWLDQLPTANLGYASYFEGNPTHDGPHSLDSFPTARTRFAQHFGN